MMHTPIESKTVVNPINLHLNCIIFDTEAVNFQNGLKSMIKVNTKSKIRLELI